MHIIILIAVALALAGCARQVSGPKPAPHALNKLQHKADVVKAPATVAAKPEAPAPAAVPSQAAPPPAVSAKKRRHWWQVWKRKEPK